MQYLLASFLLTNTLHGWLVFSHRGINPASLSYHSVKSRTVFLIYAVGHIISGALLWLFIPELFGGKPQSPILIGIAAVAVVCEWAQAILPAKGKTEKLHTIFAIAMSSTMALLVLLCTLFFAPNKVVLVINLLISALVASFFLFMQYPPQKNFWKFQFAGQLLLYIQLFLLVY